MRIPFIAYFCLSGGESDWNVEMQSTVQVPHLHWLLSVFTLTHGQVCRDLILLCQVRSAQRILVSCVDQDLITDLIINLANNLNLIVSLLILYVIMSHRKCIISRQLCVVFPVLLIKVFHIITRINVHFQIEGFNEDSGRVIVRLSFRSSSVTVNENAFELVTEEEYSKNSRVLSEYYMLYSRAWLNYF